MSKEGRMGTKQISPATEIGSCFFPNLRNAIKQISYILDVLEASIGNVQDWIEVCIFYWLPSSQQYLRFSINSERVVITEWKRHFVALSLETGGKVLNPPHFKTPLNLQCNMISQLSGELLSLLTNQLLTTRVQCFLWTVVKTQRNRACTFWQTTPIRNIQRRAQKSTRTQKRLHLWPLQ